MTAASCVGLIDTRAQAEVPSALQPDTSMLVSWGMAGTGLVFKVHLFTTWGGKKDTLTEYRPMVEGLKLLKSADK